MDNPVPVSSPYGWVTAVAASGTFLTLIGVIVRQINPWRKQTIEGDKALIVTLSARVDKLEKDLESERATAKKTEQLLRHRVNNSDQCLDALLLILKTSPGKVEEAIKLIEEMRDRHRKEIAIERGALHEDT